MPVRLPTNSQRTFICGRTGTGKTQAGAWLLSTQNYNSFPWVIYDTKGDSLLQQISRMDGSKNIRFADKIGKNGLHFLHPLPHEMKSDANEAFLWRLWKRRNVGIFIDEGYMFDKFSDALITLYTQGRSLHIPMITLSQKPRYLTQFTFSEADFFQVFQLNDINDRKRITEFTSIDPEYMGRRLPDYHSLWYDVAQDRLATFSPVPAREAILETFAAGLRTNHKVI